MSDKRFCETERACYYTSLVRDTLINEKLGTDKVVDLLNSLVDENEELLKKENHLHKVITRKDKRINNLVRNKEQLKKELDEFKEVIIDKVQYGEDNLENFLIQKGIIKEDWARFDGYD